MNYDIAIYLCIYLFLLIGKMIIYIQLKLKSHWIFR